MRRRHVRGLADEQLVERRADRPDVGARIDLRLGAHLLRRHVVRRAEDRARGGLRSVGGLLELRDAEIENAYRRGAFGSRDEEDVRRLHVAMDDPRSVRRL